MLRFTIEWGSTCSHYSVTPYAEPGRRVVQLHKLGSRSPAGYPIVYHCTTSIRDQRPVCDCPSYAYEKSDQGELCKHLEALIAIGILRLAEPKLEPHVEIAPDCWLRVICQTDKTVWYEDKDGSTKRRPNP